jgi:predicted DsbA family dithiol-disulfide isomerase
MKLEVWSDVVCPFCYIGKRKLEKALAKFAHKENIELEWKSFQLSPDTKTDTSTNINRYLAEHKGVSLEQAKLMNDRVTEMAEQVGLEYNFDNAVVANTFMAHRLLHFAKEQGKQNEAKELLLKSYFTDGKNIDDSSTLLELGTKLGLDKKELSEVLENGAFANEVTADIREAQQLGVRGVPFFVFDRKYGISGAQDVSVFTQTLEKSFEEWRTNHPEPLQVIEGESCDIDGECK